MARSALRSRRGTTQKPKLCGALKYYDIAILIVTLFLVFGNDIWSFLSTSVEIKNIEQKDTASTNLETSKIKDTPKVTETKAAVTTTTQKKSSPPPPPLPAAKAQTNDEKVVAEASEQARNTIRGALRTAVAATKTQNLANGGKITISESSTVTINRKGPRK